MRTLKENLTWIIAGLLASSLVGAASAAVTARALAPEPVQAPPQACPEPQTDERVVALLTELVETDRAKRKRQAQQQAASKRYLRPMSKPSKPAKWTVLPKPQEAGSPSE